jgi:Zn-dependent protease
LDPSRVQDLLLSFPILLMAFVAHEYAHGYAALKEGDPTAQMLGRLTWNPAKHVEPVGTILLPILSTLFMGAPFGWAKPCPVTPRNFRRGKTSDIVVSLAGVTANLLLAIACAALMVPTGLLATAVPAAAESLFIAQAMLKQGVWINLWLIVINLLPIPGFDGSHVVKHMLPPAWAFKYQQAAPMGFFILMALSWVGMLGYLLRPATLATRLLLSPVSSFVLPASSIL